jgi:hypothetical protein
MQVLVFKHPGTNYIMADDFGLGGILGSFSNLATSQGASGWLGIGINIILSTIVGGVVLLVVMEALSKAWGESVSAGRCFVFVLIINIITQFGMSFIIPYVSFLPMAVIVVQLLLWVVFMKLFFSELTLAHAAIAGVIGFVLSILLVPMLTGLVMGFIPLKF